jgi:esterase/lipase superfamily enzyme
MHREYHRWYSSRLGRDMELLVHGHAGARVLAFPPRMGRFYDYEDKGMVDALHEPLEKGWLQLFCVDSVDRDGLYCDWKHPGDRIWYHHQYEEYILCEVLPLTQRINSNPFLISHGCSLGAFHAVNIALRHPHLFGRIIAFSGRYDLTSAPTDFGDLFGGHYDERIYFHTPNHYLPGLHDEAVLANIRRLDIILVVGEEDPFVENTRALSRALWEKNVWHALHFWWGRAHRFRYWRQMARIYF